MCLAVVKPCCTIVFNARASKRIQSMYMNIVIDSRGYWICGFVLRLLRDLPLIGLIDSI